MTNTPRDDGGPAFPVTLLEGQTLGDGTANGMTLRDYFAGQAINTATQMWQESSTQQRRLYSDCRDSGIVFQRDFPKFVANVTYWIAGAMIAARKGADQ